MLSSEQGGQGLYWPYCRWQRWQQPCLDSVQLQLALNSPSQAFLPAGVSLVLQIPGTRQAAAETMLGRHSMPLSRGSAGFAGQQLCMHQLPARPALHMGRPGRLLVEARTVEPTVGMWGTKQGMDQFFTPEGECYAATIVKFAPGNIVTQVISHLWSLAVYPPSPPVAQPWWTLASRSSSLAGAVLLNSDSPAAQQNKPPSASSPPLSTLPTTAHRHQAADREAS